MPLPNLEQETTLPMPLSPDLASLTSSPKDVTEDILAYADPPTLSTHFHEFEVGDNLDIPGGLDMNVVTEVKPHNLDDSEDISQELCDEVIEPTILDFDDDILSIENESFSCRFDVNVSLDVDLCTKYESFSVGHVQADVLFEYCKFEIVEPNNVVTKNFDLNQTLGFFNITRLVNFAPTILPRCSFMSI